MTLNKEIVGIIFPPSGDSVDHKRAVVRELASEGCEKIFVFDASGEQWIEESENTDVQVLFRSRKDVISTAERSENIDILLVFADELSPYGAPPSWLTSAELL
mmetsp:Transcript_42577/g.109516  ORF Transcript_42577/g.109516 Transcript_42577/m.109516 type:complete len:103 (+) Transcript_42577:179-487(+)